MINAETICKKIQDILNDRDYLYYRKLSIIDDLLNDFRENKTKLQIMLETGGNGK